MRFLLEFLGSNGPLLILAVSFLETLGLPLPAFPFLVLAGCLVVENSLSLPLTLLAAVLGTLSADLFWYWLGKRMGKRALKMLCRISLNPDACVDRSESLFFNHSTAAILTAKLFPGLNTLVPSLAGVLGMKPWRYAILDAAGSMIWAGAGLGLGFAFGRGVLSRLESVRYPLMLLLVAMLAFYVIFRIGYRRYVSRRYSVPRIQPDELRRRLASGDGVVVVDLRNNLAYAESSHTLPNALRISPSEFEAHVDSLPREKDIVFYCT
jgi:membrane protein DedA with SNARE-associated domain